MINGQVNLYDANRRQVDFKIGPKEYKLRTDRTLPTLIVRPRGWHLEEKHVTVDGEPVSGSLFDFGLYFFHNAFETVRRGIGPYFYLPKMESHLEARLWNDVFNLAQDHVGMPRGTIRGTVLIESRKPPRVLEVTENQKLAVRADDVVGWVGRLMGHPLDLDAAPLKAPGFVAFSGSGSVLVDLG